jgi:capsular polysaccharide biosynthesis protein
VAGSLYREVEGAVEQGREGKLARRALVSVLAAVGVVMASLQQAPTYEASAHVLVGWHQEGRLETLEFREPPIQTLAPGIDSRSVAHEVIYRLGLEMTPEELLDNLTAEQVEGTQFIQLTYESNNPVEAQRIVNTVGVVFSDFISERSSEYTASLWDKAAVPTTQASPHPLRNGLLTLAIGLVLSAMLALPQPRPFAARVPAVPRTDPREAEQELLEALDRRGRLTAVEAALETSLSVEESRQILEALAVAGHLEITVEHGRLYYAHWQADGP